jgi:hypothetical protein
VENEEKEPVEEAGEESNDLSLDMLRNLSRKEKKVLLKRLKRLAKKIQRSI